MKKYLLRVVSLCVVAVMLFGFTAQAASGPSFTHWETAGKNSLTVASRDMYKPVLSFSASDVGVAFPFEGITDIFCTEDGKTFLLCGEANSKLYLLNKDYTLDKEIVVKDADGKKVNFEGARGVYVNDGVIYLCDTANYRVLLLDYDGNITGEITVPDADVIPDDFMFQPTEVAHDNDNNMYVLSLGSYYGALVYNTEMEFTGFYGANTVQYTVLDFFGHLWEMLTTTDTKREKSTRTLPYAFVSMCTDKEGFIYTTTASPTGQLRMLSPGGTNILKYRDLNGDSADATSYNFVESKLIVTHKKFLGQKMVVIDVNDEGYIYALDSTYGFVYIYDADCNLLSAFGGGVEQGDEMGLFSKAIAMCLNGDQVVVGDSETGRVTVFEMTEYGALVQKAQKMYFKGDYADSKPLWEEVLKMDSNSRLAYRGLAKAYYVLGDFEASMKYAEISYDYTTYDQAYRQVRNKNLENNFIWFFVVIIVLVAAIILFLLYMKKRKTSMFDNIKIRTLMNVPLHPFQVFTDVKYKGYGSLPAAIILIALFAFTATLRITASSFLFRAVDVYNYNSLFTLATTAGLLVLWIVANWLACTLMEGKGRMDEIAIVTAYSFIPMIIYNVLYTGLSYVLSYEDAAILNGLMTVLTIYTAFLMIVAIMTVHEYTFGKLVLSTLITLFFMILVVFVIFMMVILVQQLWNFFISLYTEVAYR